MPDFVCVASECNDYLTGDLGVSDACSTCFGDAILSISETCLWECVPDLGGTTAACMACAEQYGVAQEFEECSGILLEEYFEI
jgi:hypothetical protein